MLVYKKYLDAKNDRTNVSVTGATTEVATLKEALSKVEDNAAVERTKREKQDARVAEVQQELHALVKNTIVWSLTQRLESPSLPRPLRAPNPPRPKPKEPSKKLRR